MEKSYYNGNFYLKPLFADFGAVFCKDLQQLSTYPSYGTRFYFD